MEDIQFDNEFVEKLGKELLEDVQVNLTKF